MEGDEPCVGLPAPVRFTLPDGEAATIRAIHPGDAPLLQEAYRALSAESIYLRFFSHAKELTDAEAGRLADVDYCQRMAFVATVEGDAGERIVGVARYEMCQDPGNRSAQCAVVVGDSYQRQGIATALLRQLVAYARVQGVQAFTGTILAANSPILRLAEASGLPCSLTSASRGVFEIEIRLDA